ncbi:MAG TPA: Gfo/Idh/MocA family oxidoreductase [Vicinamibacteria bacterium]|nr:Gfo/Idh/MocA family oxidoreductase [Vicinamibacteria bacterium]
MKDGVIGVGIAGVGVAARYHARAITDAPGARLSAVCRVLGARVAEAEEAFGVPCETSYEALLARPDVDAVCLCTPSGHHAGQAIGAARAGKHVLVEKPMALTLEDADAMIAAARENGVRLAVAFQRRTEPVYADLRATLATGELGRPVLGVVTIPYLRTQAYYDSAGWRGTWALDGGGVLMNQGIHLVDLLVWLLGEVEEVEARIATAARDIEVEDVLVATLRFASGALGTVAATTCAAPGFPHRVEIYGTRGGVQVEGDAVTRWEEEGKDAAAANARLSEPARIAAGPGASPTGIPASAHGRLVADFIASIRESRPPLVSGEEGRRALSVVLAIYEAARSGRPVRPR